MMRLRYQFLVFFFCTLAYVQNALGSHFGDNWEKILDNHEKQQLIPLHTTDKKLYYFAVNNKATFLEAEEFCRGIHMSLVTIKSREELEDLYEYSEEITDQVTFWSAGSKLLDNEHHVWLTTGDLVDTNLIKNADDDEHVGSCLTLKRSHSNKRLIAKSRNCDKKYNFICERLRFEPTETCDQKDQKWDALFRDPAIADSINLLHTKVKTYYIGTSLKASYQEASQFCHIINMDLVSITKKKKDKKLAKYIRENNLGVNFWTSGTRVLDGKKWLWLASGQPLTYTNWAQREPREPRGEENQCIMLSSGYQGLQWKTANCKAKAAFICESRSNKEKKKKSKLRFDNLDDVSDYVTEMRHYLQQIGLIVGSMLSPQHHFRKSDALPKSEVLKHLDIKTVEYITLLLEYLYDYIVNLSHILENPNERVKYNTQDIKSAIVSVQTWLAAIRKLLDPNAPKVSDNNCKGAPVTNWERCIKSLNHTMQNYALLIGLVFVPTDKDSQPDVNEIDLVTMNEKFSKVITTLLKPVFGNVVDPEQPKRQPKEKGKPLLAFPSLPDFPVVPDEPDTSDETDEPSEEDENDDPGKPKHKLPTPPRPPKVNYGPYDPNNQNGGNRPQRPGVGGPYDPNNENGGNRPQRPGVGGPYDPNNGKGGNRPTRPGVGVPQTESPNSMSSSSASNALASTFGAMFPPFLNASMQPPKNTDSSSMFSSLQSQMLNSFNSTELGKPTIIGSITPGVISFQTMVQQSQMSITEWTEHGRKFMAVKYKATPEEAAKMCQSHGLELISIKDQATSDILARFLSRTASNDVYWTSGRRSNYDDMLWGDGSSMSYSNWAYGMPVTYDDVEDCIAVQEEGQWINLPCTGKEDFFCEDINSPMENAEEDIGKPFLEISFGSRSLKKKADNSTKE